MLTFILYLIIGAIIVLILSLIVLVPFFKFYFWYITRLEQKRLKKMLNLDIPKKEKIKPLKLNRKYKRYLKDAKNMGYTYEQLKESLDKHNTKPELKNLLLENYAQHIL